MRANTQFTVSVQIMILISISSGGKITSNMIAESTGCNPVMVRQLFRKLKESGLIHVTAGSGATTLARTPSEISLWDVYAAAEGSGCKDLFAFHPEISKTCKVGRQFEAVLSSHLDDTVNAMKTSLEQVTLQQLVSEILSAAASETVPAAEDAEA